MPGKSIKIMNIKASFKSISSGDLAGLAVGAVLCACGMAAFGGWTAEHAVSTSIAGFIIAIPMAAMRRAF